MQKKYWKNLKIFKTTNPEPSFLKTFSLAANSYLISLEKLKRLTVTQNISILLFIKSKFINSLLTMYNIYLFLLN